MKISELKQPYRRMAEYLADKNTDEEFKYKEILTHKFNWFKIHELFWEEVNEGNHPKITEEIKSYFPTDFDFSGDEEIKTKPVIQMLDQETQKAIYTQLAKEGKFDELPETCEFSEPVELEVWDGEREKFLKLTSGKYRGLYMDLEFQAWDYAQLPLKIDFSEFKKGNVVEIEKKEGVYFYGEIRLINEDLIKITMSKVSEMTTILGLQNIKSIKKLK